MFGNIEQNIVLLRHARAVKNEQNRHGGEGSELIKGATTKIQVVSNQLLQKFSTKFNSILYSTRTQCKQTAEILNKYLDIEISELQGLDPICLGIVDGMSDDEVTNKYPEIGIQLAKWRNGEIEINQLKIPQMTDCHFFYRKGKTFLEKITNSNQSVIIVSSRSILALLANILFGNSSQIGGNYREVKWENLEFASFTKNHLSKSFHLNISTLKR